MGWEDTSAAPYGSEFDEEDEDEEEEHEHEKSMSTKQTGPMFLLHSPRSDLHGYEFTDEAHAQRWIDQDINVFSKKPARCHVYERLTNKRRCACCGERHYKPGKSLRRLVPRTPSDDERAEWGAKMKRLREELSKR